MTELKSRNPYTGELLETYATATDAEIERAIAGADARFRAGGAGVIDERARGLARLADALDRNHEELARLAVAEMGKTLKAARAEVEKCAATARWFAERLPELARDESVGANSGAASSGARFVRRLPLGPVLAVMPWNFPFWQAFRAAIPALAAGNTMLLKHASNVSGCALRIERAFLEAGFPPGVFKTVLLESSRVARLIADPRIRGVTLTGSEAAGRSVAETAGRHLKKCVLELGGSDPFLVLPSADLAAAAASAVTARTLNNGQSCIAAKRFIVHADVFEAFTRAFVDGMSAVRPGDPMREDAALGPLVHAEAVDALQEQCARAVRAGAEARLAPEVDEAKCLFSPAVLIAPENAAEPVFSEELFGPVAVVHRARSLEHGLRLCNESRYGLGSSVWTKDAAEAGRAVDGIDAGMTFVNAIVASEAALPFGGVKDSGYGRELGALGFAEFTNAKAVAFGAAGVAGG